MATTADKVVVPPVSASVPAPLTEPESEVAPESDSVSPLLMMSLEPAARENVPASALDTAKVKTPSLAIVNALVTAPEIVSAPPEIDAEPKLEVPLNFHGSARADAQRLEFLERVARRSRSLQHQRILGPAGGRAHDGAGKQGACLQR